MRGFRLGLIAASAVVLLAQPAPGPLTVAPIPLTSVRRGETLPLDVAAQLRAGYHTNSNTPSEEYLIPLKLTWDTAGVPADIAEILYPKPKLEKYEFSPKPVSVFSGDFRIQTKFRIRKNAPMGPVQVTGKLRYQACTNKECLPPKTVPVAFTLNVK